MARRPVNAPYTITTQFGVPDSYAKFGRHSGVDYAVPLNRPIYAPVSGQLTNIVSPTGGNMVQIFDGKYYHRLMHNNSFSRGNGQVNEGDEVAKAGTTGLSTGVHSHWDVATRADPTSFSDFIDPMEYIKQGGTVKPTREQIVHTIQIILGYTPGEAEINAQLGQASLYDVVKSLGDAAQERRDEAAVGYEQITEPVYKKKGQ